MSELLQKDLKAFLGKSFYRESRQKGILRRGRIVSVANDDKRLIVVVKGWQRFEGTDSAWTEMEVQSLDDFRYEIPLQQLLKDGFTEVGWGLQQVTSSGEVITFNTSPC